MGIQNFFDRPSFRIFLGLIAFLLTATLGYYQRRTGPSWPVPVAVDIAEAHVSGSLPRSHPGEGGAEIRLATTSSDVVGEILWRRYPTNDEWSFLEMRLDGLELVAELPHQAPAGKLEYSLRLRAEDSEVVLPGQDAVVIRFRGDVPAGILIPHILFMFLALAFSLRVLLGALLGEAHPGGIVPWLLGVLVAGGLILGPMVQKHAFGAYWTGWPFGGDWTDNKTLFAVIAWALALLVIRKLPKGERLASILAAAVMLGVYLIPHSIHGSELAWDEVQEAEETESAAEVSADGS